MNKLNRAVDRFAYNHPNFGISNLIRYIVFGQIIVYVLYMFSHSYGAISFLTFDLAHLLQGELWRLVTWVFMPHTFQPLGFLISALCYYSIGTSLEQTWGTAKFNLYYFCGMGASVLAMILVALITGGWGLALSSSYYLNMTLFLALAVMYPDAVFNLWVIVFPLRMKAKWLVWLYGILMGIDLVTAVLRLDLVGIVLPLVSMMNFLVFFWREITYFFGVQTKMARHQNSAKTIRFKTAAKEQQRKEAARGYRHKCTVCGRTDADFPELEFRYCSRCAGYHCYCADHIFDHQHFTE